MQKNRIDALCNDDLTTVGKIYQLADLLQQPVVDIFNSLGIIKTYGIGAATNPHLETKAPCSERSE
jgi:hypothetical protein